MLAACAVAALIGCGTGEGESADREPAPIGQITQLKGDLVKVGDEEVEQRGHKLFPGSVITSTLDGGAIFRIDGKVKACDFDDQVELEALPSPEVLLRIVEGSATCVTADMKGNPKREKFEAGTDSDVSVEFVDPVFNVTSGGDNVEMWVEFGFIEVSRQGAGKQLLGPGSQTTVAAAQLPAPPAPFEPDQLDVKGQQALAGMMSDLPEPNYAAPEAGDSQTLQRILRSRQLNIGIEENRSNRSAAFITGLMGFLAEQWRLSLDVSYMGAPEARAALEAARLDLFFSPDTLAGPDYLPLFADENGVRWSMSTERDSRLEASILAFLRSALDYGEYRDRYLEAFGRLPSYEAVYSLAFPDPDGATEEAPLWRRQDRIPNPADGRLAPPSPTPTGRPDPSPSTLRVTDVALSADPSRYSGPCPTTLRFAGSITVEGSAGDVDFRYRGAEGSTSGAQRLSFSGEGTRQVSFTKTIESSERGSQTLEVVAPSAGLADSAEYEVRCQEGGSTDPVAEVLDDVGRAASELAESLTNLLNGLLGGSLRR